MKLDLLREIKRLVIYFFYDTDGIVDRYVPYMLEDICRNCSELFIVCNGKLTSEGWETFRRFTQHVMVRENRGFDVWAYKAALEHYGWEKLDEFDEVVMMNFTIFGPLYPFAEMFGEMNRRDLDFWGITAFHKVAVNPYGTVPYGYIPRHLQSCFIAVRKTMLSSPKFHAYWESRPEITDYGQAIGMHEAIFTKIFEDSGFTWNAYIDTNSMADYTTHPLMKAPIELVRDMRCPIFKRRNFFHNYYDFLEESNGSQSRELLEYIEQNTDYDVEFIWENILRTSHMADIKNNLHLNYILSQEYCHRSSCTAKTALILHIYFEDRAEYCYHYALSMPPGTDLYVTTDTEAKARRIRNIFSKGPWETLIVIVIENRGRDVSALLVGAAPYIQKHSYDAICFAHDKKVTQLPNQMTGHYFSERCFKNILATGQYVKNVIQLMCENKRLGMLVPPPPNFSHYYSTTGSEWGDNYESTKELAEKLGLHVPMDPGKEPIAPLGTMFWFKPDALKTLLEYPWQYENFPKEPNHVDGTVLHAIERLYPFAAQARGYYTAWVMTNEQAQLEWNNLNYMQREINTILFGLCGPKSFCGLLAALRHMSPSKRIRIKKWVRSKVPDPVWNWMKKAYRLIGGRKWIG